MCLATWLWLFKKTLSIGWARFELAPFYKWGKPKVRRVEVLAWSFSNRTWNQSVFCLTHGPSSSLGGCPTLLLNSTKWGTGVCVGKEMRPRLKDCSGGPRSPWFDACALPLWLRIYMWPSDLGKDLWGQSSCGCGCFLSLTASQHKGTPVSLVCPCSFFQQSCMDVRVGL